MNHTFEHHLLDPPPLTANRLESIEQRVAGLLDTELDVVLMQAEAIFALEAIARGVSYPGLRCLNVVTGPYGAIFGEWLKQAGAEVSELRTRFDRAVSPADVVSALDAGPEFDVLSFVHAEAATGAANSLTDLAALASERNLLTIVDAVASVGAHPLEIDALDIDFCAIGPQKGLAGPAGVSAVTVSQKGWSALTDRPAPWRGSSLSLLDWKEKWIDAGRTLIPGTPVPLELFALDAACERIKSEGGLGACVARHCRAAVACRAGVIAMGAEPWIGNDAQAAHVTTSIQVPEGIDADLLVSRAGEEYGVTVTPGAGELRDLLVRLDHMGRAADPAFVSAGIAGLGAVLKELGASVDPGAGTEAALARLREPDPPENREFNEGVAS